MKPPTTYREILAITIHNHIKKLAMYYVLDALTDYILDPFSQLNGSDIDG